MTNDYTLKSKEKYDFFPMIGNKRGSTVFEYNKLLLCEGHWLMHICYDIVVLNSITLQGKVRSEFFSIPV